MRFAHFESVSAQIHGIESVDADLVRDRGSDDARVHVRKQDFGSSDHST
jgi:hypothetical protein